MPTFVTLINFTEDGIDKVKESPARLDAARAAFRAVGAEIKDFYLVMGRYDIVLIGEAPDAETAAGLALAIGSQGNVRTETMRAFTEDEYREIVDTLR